jgi:hypothetical protein
VIDTRVALDLLWSKISVQARDAIGRTEQLSTVQLDFNQPEAIRPGILPPPDGTRPAAG